MLWEALSPRRLAALLASLNRQHASLQRMLRALELDGIEPSTDPLYHHLEQAADKIADTRFLVRTRLRRANGGGSR